MGVDVTEHDRATELVGLARDACRGKTEGWFCAAYQADADALTYAISVLTVYPALIDAARDVLRHFDCRHDPRDPEHCTTCRLAELSGYEGGDDG